MTVKKKKKKSVGCLGVGYYLGLWATTDVLTDTTRQGKPPVRGGVNLFFPSTLSSLVKGQEDSA